MNQTCLTTFEKGGAAVDTNERRVYQRSKFDCDARVSSDGFAWKRFEVRDLSSGGLQMHLADEYEIGAKLWFDLTLYGVSTQFDVKVQGVVRRRDKTPLYYVYGICFIDVPQDTKIRIDESIRKMRPKEFLL